MFLLLYLHSRSPLRCVTEEREVCVIPHRLKQATKPILRQRHGCVCDEKRFISLAGLFALLKYLSCTRDALPQHTRTRRKRILLFRCCGSEEIFGWFGGLIVFIWIHKIDGSARVHSSCKSAHCKHKYLEAISDICRYNCVEVIKLSTEKGVFV